MRRLVTREKLLRAVWSSSHASETLLRGSIRDLRAALRDDAASPRFIETVPNRGYRFLADVRVKKSAEDTTPGAGDGSAALLEREKDLVKLREWLERSLKRQRQLVFVTGEPGIGKTSLADAFLGPLPARDGLLVGRGRDILVSRCCRISRSADINGGQPLRRVGAPPTVTEGFDTPDLREANALLRVL